MEYTHSQLLKTQRKIRISLKEHCNVTNYDLGKHAAKVANHHVLKPCTIQQVIFRITKIMKYKQSLFTVRISFKCYRFSHSPYQVLADKIEGETHNSQSQKTHTNLQAAENLSRDTSGHHLPAGGSQGGTALHAGFTRVNPSDS